METWETKVMYLFFAKKAFLWAKHNWVILAIVAYTFIMWLVFRRNTTSALEVIKTKQKSYDAQVKILKEKHHDELIKRNQLTEKYKSALEQIQKKYDKEEQQLEEEKKQKIKEIVAISKGNPDVIKKQIEEAFGFTYID
jgi:CII-binding regulator of phage lambda lysogenization HflD